jgi:uncharacterized protein (TIRG00374 family)
MPQRRLFSGRYLVSFAVSIVVFAVFFTVFDAAAIVRRLQGVHLGPVVVGFGAVALAMACWAESMRRVLGCAGGILSPSRAFLAYAAGMFAKQILPMGNAGGVPIMAYAFDRQAKIGFNRSLAVVTVGDFLGLVSSLVLATIGVGCVAATIPGTRLLGTALVVVVLATVTLLSVGVLLLYRQRVLKYIVLGIAHVLRGTFGRLSRRIEHRLAPEPLSASIDRYFETVDTVRGDRRSLLVAFALAFVGWTLFAVPLYTSAIAVGQPIPFGLVLFVVSVGGIATLVPLPGGLGGVEFAIAGLIVVTANVDPAVAGATVLVYRLCVYWLPVAIGFAAAVYTGVSVRSLDDSVERVPDLDANP